MDAITLLKDDHKTVERLFKRFEKAGSGAYTEKRELADRIIEELSKHAVIEEQLFYPVTRATVPDVEDVALESLEEHHIVKWVLSELDEMDPSDERFVPKMTVLIENVRHHVEEEEGEYFPKVREELGRKDLQELGEALAQAKAMAPTHPHPRAPDTPPGNLIAGAAAGVADRLTDTVSGLAQGGASAAQDLIARILGTRSSAKQPRGTSTARKTATKVREASASATGGKTSTRRSPTRTAAKRTAAKRTSPRRTAAKRTSPKRTSPKRTAAKRTSPKRTSPKRTSAQSTSPKRTTPGKGKSAKRTSAKRASAKRKVAAGRS